MQQIDWSKAPEGATHYTHSNPTNYETWWKIENGIPFFICERIEIRKWTKGTISPGMRLTPRDGLPQCTTTPRYQALEFLVKHLPTWPNNSFTDVLPHGWSWEMYSSDARLCHTLYNPITREDWENAKQSFTRDQMLERLVKECDKWFTEEQGLAGGWYVKKVGEFENRRPISKLVTKFTVTKTGQKNITRENWENAKQVERLSDTPFTYSRAEFEASKQPPFIMHRDDPVHKPNHYQMIDGVESIQVIACSLTRDEWRGFCLGNELKYRMRAGKKDALQQDIDKANEYGALFEKYKGLNRDER
jgi:hypothetical protein